MGVLAMPADASACVTRTDEGSRTHDAFGRTEWCGKRKILKVRNARKCLCEPTLTKSKPHRRLPLSIEPHDGDQGLHLAEHQRVEIGGAQRVVRHGGRQRVEEGRPSVGMRECASPEFRPAGCGRDRSV